MIRLAINGCCGKMGRRILDLASNDSAIKVVAGLERKGHPELGKKISGVLVSGDVSVVKQADIIIDFTAAQSTMEILAAAVQYKKALVIGTTGLRTEEAEIIRKASASIAIVFSPNMSIGVNLLFKLVKEAAGKLRGYKVKIKEAHHIHKKDAPSGTAKKIAEIVQEQTGNKVNDIESIREGEIIGDHEITFDCELDTIVLSHSAKTRDIFAKGSIEAAKWVVNRTSGLFTMQDVIG